MRLAEQCPGFLSDLKDQDKPSLSVFKDKEILKNADEYDAAWEDLENEQLFDSRGS